MASPKEEITILEHSTLKVPYELLNKKFRAVQKALDREVVQINSTSADLTQSKSSGVTMSSVSGILSHMEQKITSLKRKAEESLEEEIEYAQLCKKRIDHLKSYISGEQTEGTRKIWQKKRVDRMLVDHLLRSGFYLAAQKLADSSELGGLVDVDIFLVCQKVEEGLKNRNTGPCLAFCQENRSKLKRLKSTLELQVRLQDFIELIRSDKRLDAIKYARKYFTSSSTGDLQIREIQTAMGLLAFSPSTKCRRYQKLFSDSRWEDLIVQFRKENFSLYQLSPHSVMSITLQAGLSALKTPQCYKPESFSTQCPVCSKPLNELSASLPYSHCSQSYLICSLSGQPMNEHNPPMALPNGYIYGEQALKLMAGVTDGKVTCPRTKETFKFSEVKKVFVM